MLKALMAITIPFLLTGFVGKTKNDCLKITCLNTRDTVSQKKGQVKTYFLIESLADTLSGFNIRSSCGCEYPVWKKEMRVYPGHADTVVIFSSVKDHLGYWLKQSTISAGSCSAVFTTGPWIVRE